MRTLTGAEQAALLRSPLPLAMLLEMDLSTPLNITSGGSDLTYAAVKYLTTKGLGKVEPVQESPSEIKPLKFELSGVPSSSISLALGEPVQGKDARLKLAIYDPDTYQILGARQKWAGRLDVMLINDDGLRAVLEVTAEHAAIDLLRPVISLYTNAEQQRLNPGDLIFQYLADQVEARVIWPAAAFFRQK